jgi:hypothetical protein
MSIEVEWALLELVKPVRRPIDDGHTPLESSYQGVSLTSLQHEKAGSVGYTRYLPGHTQRPLVETRTRSCPEVASDLGPVPHSPAGYGYFPGIFQWTRTRARC